MPAYDLPHRCIGALTRYSVSKTHSLAKRQMSSSLSSLSGAGQQEHHDFRSSSSTRRILPWMATAAAGAAVTVGTLTFTSDHGNRSTKAEPARAQVQLLHVSPDSYPPHRTLQEMNEQPEAIARALNFGECMSYEKVLVTDLDQNQDKVSKIDHLTLSAQGTSLNAARYGERLMKELGIFTTVASIDSALLQTSDFPCLNVDSTGLIVVSDNSQCTKDISDVVASAKDKGVTVMNVVDTIESLLSTASHHGDLENDSNADADADTTMSSTKAFTTQVTVLALIALWFKESRDRELGNGPSSEAMELKEALMRLPIAFGMTLKKRDQCREIAKRLQDKEHCFVLGKGYAEPVAHKGAFNIAEISGMRTDCYKGGAIQHVSCALVEGEAGRTGATPVIMFILNDQHAQGMRMAAKEAKARGADLVIITDNAELAEGLDESPIVLPTNGPLTALGGILPLQLIAYELAIIRGINPDGLRDTL